MRSHVTGPGLALALLLGACSSDEVTTGDTDEGGSSGGPVTSEGSDSAGGSTGGGIETDGANGFTCFGPALENLHEPGEFLDVAVTPEGGVVVVGHDGFQQGLIRKLGPDGDTNWEVTRPESVRAVDVSGTGQIVTLEGGKAWRFSADGEWLWSSAGVGAERVVAGADDTAFVSGFTTAPASYLGLSGPDGAWVWTVHEPEVIRAGAALTGGGVAVVIGENHKWRVRAHDVMGESKWDTPIPGPANSPELATDAAGNLYAAGQAYPRLWLRKLGPDGTPLWTVEDTIGDAHDQYSAVAIADGQIALSGYTQHQDPLTAFLRRFDADGTELETVLCPSAPDSRAYGMDMDATGRLTVVGAVSVDGPYRQWLARLP